LSGPDFDDKIRKISKKEALLSLSRRKLGKHGSESALRRKLAVC
jgi:hypothetical protein